MEAPSLLTVADVARLLRRSVWSIYSDAAAGRFPAIRVGGTIRFRRADVEAWLDANRIKPAAKPRTTTAAAG